MILVEVNNMKTLDIFKKYEALYNEADELELDDQEADATDIAEQPPVEDVAPESVSPEGEKFLAGLLIKAFLHEPDASGAQAAVDLQSKIDENPKDVIDAISNLVKIGEGDLKDTLELA